MSDNIQKVTKQNKAKTPKTNKKPQPKKPEPQTPIQLFLQYIFIINRIAAVIKLNAMLRGLEWMGVSRQAVVTLLPLQCSTQ